MFEEGKQVTKGKLDTVNIAALSDDRLKGLDLIGPIFNMLEVLLEEKSAPYISKNKAAKELRMAVPTLEAEMDKHGIEFEFIEGRKNGRIKMGDYKRLKDLMAREV